MHNNSVVEDQLSVVLVHPSRLFTAGLASLLKDTRFNSVYQLASFGSDSLPASKMESKIIFIVGGRTSSEIVKIVRSIRTRLDSAYILVINTPSGPNEVLAALEAGADGYLRDAISSQTFVRVIELIIADETILPPEFVKSLREPRGTSRDAFSADSSPEEPSATAAMGTEQSIDVKLSAREGSILRGLVEGAPNKVIAQRLHITEATVKVHVKAILRKIRVQNRTQAAIWAAKHLASSDTKMSDWDNLWNVSVQERSAGKRVPALESV